MSALQAMTHFSKKDSRVRVLFLLCVTHFVLLFFTFWCLEVAVDQPPAKTKLSRSTHNNENPSPQPFRLTNLNLNKF